MKKILLKHSMTTLLIVAIFIWSSCNKSSESNSQPVQVNPKWSELGSFPTFNSYINVITTDANGNIYAAGNFENSNGNWYVAKWNGSSWSELGGTNNSTFNNPIYTIATDKLGNIYAAGGFLNTNGNNYVAKWDGTKWGELGGNNTSTFNDVGGFGITSLTTDINGNVYAGGDFTNSKGYDYVARWNGYSWGELGGTNSSTFNGRIESIVSDIKGNIYVAGQFINNKGSYVAKWSGSSWNNLNGGNGYMDIISLAIDGNGNLYAAGAFKNSNGNYYVAKWNGTSLAELGGSNTSNFNEAINTITTDISGNVYAAGDFTNGTSSQNGNFYVAKWSGSAWSELGGNNTPTFNGFISSITSDTKGYIYAAGSFTNGNNSQNGNFYVARY